MAWNAGGAWKKPLNLTKKNDDTSFPGLKPTTSNDAASKIQYEELQQDEVLALEAIYGEDFSKQKETQTWQKSEPAFEIRIRASSNDEFAVTLSVTLTATYPRTPPLLALKEHDDLQGSTIFRIQKFIETKPKEFAVDEQPMVDGIVEGIREILEDAAQARAAGLELPSLEEERAAHETMLAEEAKKQQAEDARKRIEETKEEERVLDSLLQEELKRQKEKANEWKKQSRPSGPAHSHQNGMRTSEKMDHITFDQPCKVTDKTGNAIMFSSVTGKDELRKGPMTTIYLVHPVVPTGQKCPSLILKETTLQSNGKDLAQFKKQLQSLESQLESLKKAHHQNLVDILDFKIDRTPSASNGNPSNLWTVSILSPWAEKGSLEEQLDFSGPLDISKVRSLTADLLDALGFLHNKGIVHQSIHLGNVLLFREPNGNIVPKLAEACYQKELHNICMKPQSTPGISQAKSAYWLPPEIAGTSKPHYTQKTDVWDFGVVFLQMIFGLDVPQKYHSPSALIDSLSLSTALHELVSKFFKPDPKKRPRAFELSSSEFLATDAPVLVEDSSAVLSSVHSLSSIQTGMATRIRRESMNRTQTASRYRKDFIEEGRLGKGGFGEVVKARNMLDGQIYAIKKINVRSKTSLDETVKEVRLLSLVSHPAVVRYYNAWVEDEHDAGESEGDTSTEGFETQESKEVESHEHPVHIATSTGGLDFMSSSGYPQIEFGYDDDEDEDEAEGEADGDGDDDDDSTEGEEVGDDSSEADQPKQLQMINMAEAGAVSPPSPAKEHPQRRARFQRPFKQVLYISMEYCEKRTLRDLIGRCLYKNTDEIWRLFRQITEGLAHIHRLNIVHRDLKPENIFISHSIDEVDNVKIGDFGLAKTSQFIVDKAVTGNLEPDDITRSIGTASYAAPEVRSGVHGMYTAKVDMYSLGIILFEMCYQPIIGMHRAVTIDKLRQPHPELPADFKPADKMQKEIILSLMTHSPKDRPSSSELLQSGKLPEETESEPIRRTMAKFSDPSLPYYQKLLTTLFTRPAELTKDYAWDMNAQTASEGELVNQGIVKSTLNQIFRRHGAVEMQRKTLFPKSSHYGHDVVKLLDLGGTVLQLPYDLTLGHARALAKQSSFIPRSFAFGSVYRDRQNSAQPQMLSEVDFDIVTSDTLDLALKEAEVIKVLDEIATTFPSLATASMCFHVGHSDLLQLIFEFCRVEPAARAAAAECLSKLNIHNFTWQKIRTELRSETIGLGAISVDELQRFDFRDSPSKAFSKLKDIWKGTDIYERAASTLAYLREVVQYAKAFGVSSKIYVSPLHCIKHSFYQGGIMFACLHEKKNFRDVFSAGGRYDNLIKELRPKTGGHYDERYAVGFNLPWERLAKVPKPSGGKAYLKKTEEVQGMFGSKRCDVLVGSMDPSILRTTGIELLQTLWAHNISAELACDARTPEELLKQNADDQYTWVVILRQDMLKIKTAGGGTGPRKDVPDVDMAHAQLLSWLRGEIRERDTRAGARSRGALSASDPPVPTTVAGASGEAGAGLREQEVRLLVGQTKSKKFNRRVVVEQAQAHAAALVGEMRAGPILGVETTDGVMEQLRETRLSDPESWRRLEQAVTTAERRYVREVHDQLDTWRTAHERKGATRHSFVYNFRSGHCIYYDLGA